MENTSKKYVVSKIYKTLYDSEPTRIFQGNEIERINTSVSSIEEAKKIIDQDKKINGKTYIYTVAEDVTGYRNVVYKDLNN